MTEWAAGEEVEITWGISANHGGGYSFRLCPKPERLVDLTEECFQKLPLSFVGDQSYIQYGDYNGTATPNRTAIPARRTTSGTNPPGSQWAQIPIPPCAGTYGHG